MKMGRIMTLRGLSLPSSQGVDTAARRWESSVHVSTETRYRSERLQPEGLADDWEIYFSGFDAILARNFAHQAAEIIRHYTTKYSRFSRDSIVCKINESAGLNWVELDAEAERLFSLADRVNALTRGIIDPTMLPLLRLWNYRPAGMRRPSSTEVSVAVERIGWTRVQRQPGQIFLPEMGMCLDLEVILSKHLVDRVVELGRSMGVENLLVKRGRDMRASGAPLGAEFWVVGVEDPNYSGLVGHQLILNSCGASTSGREGRLGDRRGRDWSDVIDPRSGFPVDNSCSQVSVVAKSCLEAGLLAITAHTLGPDEGMSLVEEYFCAEGVMTCRGRDDESTSGSASYFN